MAEETVKFAGLVIARFDIQKPIKKARKVVIRALHEEGLNAKAEIRKNFSRSAPSRPGRPPAIVTGRLSRSLKFRVDPRKLALRLGVSADQRGKAQALEWGYEPRNLEPRPFLEPQQKRSERRLAKIIRARLNR
jgi:hypothetical protein